jgi:glycosyltransferase involved in cell wall biosynthesis
VTDRDYFLQERYRDAPPDSGGDGGSSAASAPFEEQAPSNFSQELFFLHNPPALKEYLAGNSRFPFYRHYGWDQLWKARPSDSPYLDRLAQIYKGLSLELLVGLARERGRGKDVLPVPAEPKARWKCVSQFGGAGLANAGIGFECAIVTPRLGIGGGEKVVRELAAALRELTGRPALIIVADSEHRGGENVLALCSLNLEDQPFFSAAIPKRAEVLRDIIVSAGIKFVFSINSFLANYAIQGEYLSDCAKIACAVFSVPLLASGEIGGFARDVDWLAPNVDAFFTENALMGSVLREHFFLETVHVLDVPEPFRDGPVPTGENILWASRIDEEKRPELLIEIAKLLPNRNFEVWGSPLLSGNHYMESILALPNVIYRGPFSSFDELDLREIGCYLYTTRYDGKPNIVVEAMSRGLVCVATAVGGVPELLGEGRGRLIPSDAGAHAYVSAILDVFGSDQSPGDGERARAFVRAVHTKENFRNGVQRLLRSMQ